MHHLVTGGAGFLGSHLVERLMREGARVTVLDDLSTGRLANLAAVRADARLTFVHGSVTDVEAVARLCREVDAVVHFAAAVGVKLVCEQAARTVADNAAGAIAVLRAAARRGLPVLVASSSEVAGDAGGDAIGEDAPVALGPTTEPRWGYACSKALEEWLALALHRESGLPVCAVRFFNVSGPRQSGRHGMVLPSFVRQALRGEPLTVHGDGRQTRSFCHVDDAVEAVVRLLAAPAAAGQVVNVGCDRETSILELARTVLARTGSRSSIRHVPMAEAYGCGTVEIRRRVPAIDRLHRLTGFRPQRPLAAIVDDVAAAMAPALAARAVAD